MFGKCCVYLTLGPMPHYEYIGPNLDDLARELMSRSPRDDAKEIC